MAMTNGTDGNKRSVSSLGELSRNVAPPRDLWPSIAAQIEANAAPAAVSPERSRLRPTGMQWAALAAVVAALAVGVWLGRSVLPSQAVEDALNRRTAQNQNPNPTAESPLSRPATEGLRNGAPANAAPPAVDPNSLQAAFVN